MLEPNAYATIRWVFTPNKTYLFQSAAVMPTLVIAGIITARPLLPMHYYSSSSSGVRVVFPSRTTGWPRRTAKAWSKDEQSRGIRQSWSNINSEESNDMSNNPWRTMAFDRWAEEGHCTVLQSMTASCLPRKHPCSSKATRYCDSLDFVLVQVTGTRPSTA